MIPIEHSARFVKNFEIDKGNNMSCHKKLNLVGKP
jgi:hypothetical protein